MRRGQPFADAFARHFVADNFGQATAHWTMLADRAARGAGNPRPRLLIGLPRSALSTDAGGALAGQERDRQGYSAAVPLL